MDFTAAKISDFDAVFGMMTRAKEDTLRQGILQWDERYPKAEMIRSDIENGYTELITVDGDAVGFFTSNSICEDDVHDDTQWLYSGERWLILHRLCIDPIHQNRGIGKAVVEKFEARAVSQGFESIRIDVFATNEKAIHIYESFGYTRVGQAVCERGPFYIYEKLL